MQLDRHALSAAGRTWADRAFGCAGNQRHATLLLEWTKRPLAPRLEPVPASPVTRAIPGTHDAAIAMLLAQASTLAYMTPCEIRNAAKDWARRICR